MSKRHLIHICGVTDRGPWSNLIGILESVLPVKLDFAESERAGQAEKISFICGGGSGASLNGVGSSTLTVGAPGIASQDAGFSQIAIRFSDEAETPFPFRGKTVRTGVRSAPKVLSLTAA